VLDAERRGQPWTSFSLEKLRTFSPAFQPDVNGALTVEAAIHAKAVPGGTAPESVRAAIADCCARLAKWEPAKESVP
jgi:argininosuccinate lyase